MFVNTRGFTRQKRIPAEILNFRRKINYESFKIALISFFFQYHKHEKSRFYFKVIFYLQKLNDFFDIKQQHIHYSR